MASLVLLEAVVDEATSITLRFSSSVTTTISKYNFSILAEVSTIPNPTINNVYVRADIVTLSTSPLTPLQSYTVVCKSIDGQQFKSLDNTQFLSENGVSNVQEIIGVIEGSNAIKQGMYDFTKDMVYDIQNPKTIVNKFTNSISDAFSKLLYEIKQLKNENYLSNVITDEVKARTNVAFDRLNEEAAYEIFRVSPNKIGTLYNKTITIDEFDEVPIALQQSSQSDIITSYKIDDKLTFNINTLKLNLSKNIIKISSISINTTTSITPIVYNVDKYGYQLLSNRYDRRAYNNKSLSDNQIVLNINFFSDNYINSASVTTINVEYLYKNLSISLNANSVKLSVINKKVRDTIPPLVNIFDFSKPNITLKNGNTPTLNGIQFVNLLNSAQAHPAFLVEMEYNPNSLPLKPGYYSVDYATSRVYVYGASDIDRGTGPYPPVATYYYKQYFTNDIDYTYDSGLSEVVSLPFGSLRGYNADITFEYDYVYINGVDYKANVHVEKLNERINNNLIALNGVRVNNLPVTNVFRIYNETSGEIYPVTRWNNDKVFFRFISPPNLNELKNETVSFKQINNEILYKDPNASGTIYKLVLNNQNIASQSEDCLGSSFNSSIKFSDGYLFKREIYYNSEADYAQSTNRLLVTGDYCVDYLNGFVYVKVIANQDENLGVVSYKIASVISTNNKHIISVDDVYYKVSDLFDEKLSQSYTYFNDDEIGFINTFSSNETSYSDEAISPYQFIDNEIKVNSEELTPGVRNIVKDVRHLFVRNNLIADPNPINFAEVCTTNSNRVSVDKIQRSTISDIKYDDRYYVVVSENVTYLTGITFTPSITSLYGDTIPHSDYVLGSTIRINLLGTFTVGDYVNVNYSFEINANERVVIDYSRGDLTVDYTYLIDEILVSYEYGDNQLDFRESTVPYNSTYYVSYKTGALRDMLIRSFAPLINIAELNNFDIEFDRERYRDIIFAALSSFENGPTAASIKNLVKNVSHIEPRLKEALFDVWSLGYTNLSRQNVSLSNAAEYKPAKYGNGIVVDEKQTISMPANSNISFENGTFETWITPNWDGLDNNNDVVFEITKNNINVSDEIIFVGSNNLHPTITDGKVIVNKKDIAQGPPSDGYLNKGIYIFYDRISDTQSLNGVYVPHSFRWFVILNLSDAQSYSIKISNNGSLYNLVFGSLPDYFTSNANYVPSQITKYTGHNFISMKYTATSLVIYSFISNNEKYILDVGEDLDKNRLSIYKNVDGYIVLKAIDKHRVQSQISYNVFDWKSGDPHYIAASWALNTLNNKDDLHLFIDGFEVPNKIVETHQLDGYTTLSGIDLHTTFGSGVVTSTLNFVSYGITVNSKIYINESGFDTAGYTITELDVGGSAQAIRLSASMPITLTDAAFVINKKEITTTINLNAYPNIGVYKIVGADEVELSGVRSSNPDYEITDNNTLTILDNVSADDVIKIKTFGLNHRDVKAKTYIWSDYNSITMITPNRSIDCHNIIMTKSPPPISLTDVVLTKTVLPTFSITKQNSVIGASAVCTITNFDSVSNLTFGKALNITISGDGYNITFPISVYIDGYSYTPMGPVPMNETIEFSSKTTIRTNYVYTRLNSAIVTIPYVNPIKNNLLTIGIEEDGNIVGPLGDAEIKYTYIIDSGTQLSSDGYHQFTDNSKIFSEKAINGFIRIYKLKSGPYYYNVNFVSKIISVSGNTITVETISGPAYPLLDTDPFTLGEYEILNNIEYRSGYQNGYFILEAKEDSELYRNISLGDSYDTALNEWGYPVNFIGYLLTKGWYNLSYLTDLSVKIDPVTKLYLGSDILGSNKLDGVIDNVKISNIQLTDTRIGEVVSSSQHSITKNFNNLIAPKKDNNTLVLLNFEDTIDNNSDYLKKYYYDNGIESTFTVNDNFDKSYYLNNPIVLDNNGIINGKDQATIDFWISTKFDTANDNQLRYYFDAFSSVTTRLTSINSTSILLPAQADSILSVRILGWNEDFFAGGSLELVKDGYISDEISNPEIIDPTNKTQIRLSNEAIQVLSIKIVGDLTNKEYVNGGVLLSDNKTYILSTPLAKTAPVIVQYKKAKDNSINTNQIIRLGKRLPANIVNVEVTYIPKGFNGDRISIYKDEDGFLIFSIRGGSSTNRINTDQILENSIKTPIVWSRNTWHKVRAVYKNNTTNPEMRMFVDGYEYGYKEQKLIDKKTNLIVRSTIRAVDHTGVPPYDIAKLAFRDTLNSIIIGADYNKANRGYCFMNNFKIDNIAIPKYDPYGEALDSSYSPVAAIPLYENAYTTYLLNSNNNIEKIEDFAILRNASTGGFDFTLDVIDSFDFVSSSDRVRTTLEKLVKLLKPANVKAYIKYSK